MRFSEFVAYGDESGTATFGKIEADFPAVGLAFCVFRVEDYVREVVPQVQALKFRHFGHDQVVLHENEVRRGRGMFRFSSLEEREAFMGDLDDLMKGLPMTIVTAVVDQQMLRDRYGKAFDAYDLGLRCCVAQLLHSIAKTDSAGPGAEVRVVAEARASTAQSNVTANRFHTGLAGAGAFAEPPPTRVELRFADKQANSAGLQIADLVVRPIVLRALRPDQQNRAWDGIAAKLYDGGPAMAEIAELGGVVTFPERQSAPARPERF